MPIDDLAAFLTGAWEIRRRIEDRRGGGIGRFTGRAIFISGPEGLDYREEGMLAMAGHAGPAFRSHRFLFPAPWRAEVLFGDGRPFHDLDLRTGSWATVHFCGGDTYRGAFRAPEAGCLEIDWEVAGPRKDLLISSRLARA